MALTTKTSSNPSKADRILSFDLLRGFLLVIILIDHVELYPSFFDLLTGRGRLFVSAAEGFFALSGLLIGMIYRRRIAQGMKFIFSKMWLRALELYIASVVFTLGYAFWAVMANHPAIKYGLPDPINWWHIINQTLLLRFAFGWSDFLPRFAILMLIAPIAFYLIAKGRWKLMLTATITLWIFRNQNFTLAWQLLFNGGMLVGFYWDEISTKLSNLRTNQKKFFKRSLYSLTVITFTISSLSVYLLSYLNERLSSLPAWLQTATLKTDIINDHVWLYGQKWTLGPLRVALFILWFSTLYLLVRKHEVKINHRTRGVLELLGRNSLFVYVLHSFIVFTFKFFIPIQTNIFQNFGITLLALLALIYGTKAYREIRDGYPKITINVFYSYLSRLRRSLASSIGRT